MKRIFLLLAFAGTFAAAKAQTAYGLKAGLNVTNVGGEDANGNKARAAFHGGAYADISVSDKFSFQPELVFSMQGANFDLPRSTMKRRLAYLNIPLMIKYHVTNPFYIEAGPQFGFLLSAKDKVGSSTNNIKKGMKNFDFGIGLGAGYKFPRSPFGVDARYNIGVSRIYERNFGQDLNVFNRVLQLGVFYELGRGK